MAKRARGLELGSETGCAPLKSMKHTLAKGSKGSQNQLANKLLALWSHGLISASLCQEFADLAMQDGAQHDELYALASTGNHGMCKARKKVENQQRYYWGRKHFSYHIYSFGL